MSNDLLSEKWINRLQNFKQLLVGFSGGLDSTVLLHRLAQQPALRPFLQAVHVNHGISANAANWQKHCKLFCRTLGIHLTIKSVDFNRSSNIEEEARKARFAVFSELLQEEGCLLLGHHLDDQAETVLLQLFRGAGVDGLAGIKEYFRLAKGTIGRPLLQSSRKQLREYAQANQLHWIEDESNSDSKFTRNYVRHQIMPLLTQKWPGVVNNLARTAAHCQQAQSNLNDLAHQDCEGLHTVSQCLSIDSLKPLEERRIINVLRVWLKKHQVQLPSTSIFKRLIHEIFWSSSDAQPLISWNTITIRRFKGHLYIDPKVTTFLSKPQIWVNFPETLFLTEGFTLSVIKGDTGLHIPEEAELIIKFRQGGERILLHGHTKQLKKLFQEWEIPPWLRGRIPLLYVNGQLASVVGYAISDLFYSDKWPSYIINQ